MKSPAAPLQRAIFAAVRADPGLLAYFKGPVRIYDHVPVDAATGKVTADFPFIHIGDEDETDDGNTCLDGAEAFFTLHVWSRAVGRVESREIADLLGQCLDADIQPVGHKIIVHQVKAGRDIDAGDGGLTSHRTVLARYATTTPLT